MKPCSNLSFIQVVLGLLLVTLFFAQQTLIQLGKAMEGWQVNQTIKTIQQENAYLNECIQQKQKINPQPEAPLTLENLLENQKLVLIERHKTDLVLNASILGSYPDLIAWFDQIPGGRILWFRLSAQNQQIHCEIRLKNVS